MSRPTKRDFRVRNRRLPPERFLQSCNTGPCPRGSRIRLPTHRLYGDATLLEIQGLPFVASSSPVRPSVMKYASTTANHNAHFALFILMRTARFPFQCLSGFIRKIRCPGAFRIQMTKTLPRADGRRAQTAKTRPPRARVCAMPVFVPDRRAARSFCPGQGRRMLAKTARVGWVVFQGPVLPSFRRRLACRRI